MSDTPETDAAVLASEGQWSFVLKETCQKLERERDKATEDATNYFARLGEVEKERDEAIADYHRVYKARDEALSQIVQAECRAERFCQERDELREVICELLKMIPRASCDMFHHSKKDRHCHEEPCPLVERYNAKIKKAEEVAK